MAPSWVVEPADEAAVFLQPAALHCQVRGHPPPVTVWLRESGECVARRLRGVKFDVSSKAQVTRGYMP